MLPLNQRWLTFQPKAKREACAAQYRKAIAPVIQEGVYQRVMNRGKK